MPSFPFSEAVGAGAVYRPLANWHYERVPAGGVVKLLHATTAIGVVCTFNSGSDTLLQRSQISAASAGAGQTPSEFDVPAIVDEVAAGDKLDLEYLKYWASRLNISDLLSRSFDDAGVT